MTLGFSQQINGKPNCFIDKIWCGLLEQDICGIFTYSDFVSKYHKKFDSYWESVKRPAPDLKPKIHTIRHDPHNRWKPGMNIHPVINNRTKNRLQFAPVVKCVSVQEVRISWFTFEADHVNNPFVFKTGGRSVRVMVNNNRMLSEDKFQELAVNDGFDSKEDFFDYFNKDFTGKIIHWTDLQY